MIDLDLLDGPDQMFLLAVFRMAIACITAFVCLGLWQLLPVAVLIILFVIQILRDAADFHEKMNDFYYTELN